MKFRLLERTKSNPGLRQFIFSVLKNKLDRDYDIHHLNGVHSDNTATNISLVPHGIHSKISKLLKNPSSKNQGEVENLLQEYGVGLEFTAITRDLSRDEIRATINIMEREASVSK